ncbi:hypothetical protein GCM10023172_17350 [Hymenobacter ginsengisoli]|uniref:SMP-30/Gluconolactonase/LRE-like region domain-containing protein n=1 Tax=Hymenobacter ginsengisoli TaxID=1051626 RepID=A0ABP8Q8G9_9BACT|nr:MULTISPECIES: hypothetical protein [unclassified Hymenobacter]MBO2030722.1 hypothetical protein [Hymenobacter sp. BT559]
MLYLVRDHLFPVLVFLHALLAGRPPDDGHGRFARLRHYRVARLAHLPAPIRESSGLAPGDSAGLVWTHGDGGTPATLYQASLAGHLRRALPLAPLVNHDWEELTRDPAGRFYIGDFGNNRNDRRNLAIYRITLEAGGRPRVDTIAFRYPDQTAFPPPAAGRHFDCEAMLFYNDTLHLFTKDRGLAHRTRYYVVPARPGHHVAVLRDSLRLRTLVTGAALRPDGRQVALLGYGALFLFAGPPGARLFQQPKLYRRLPTTGQAEAVLYLDNHGLLMSNEHGRLFRVSARRRGQKPAQPQP